MENANFLLDLTCGTQGEDPLVKNRGEKPCPSPTDDPSEREQKEIEAAISSGRGYSDLGLSGFPGHCDRSG
jgi:hypothetical protein